MGSLEMEQGTSCTKFSLGPDVLLPLSGSGRSIMQGQGSGYFIPGVGAVEPSEAHGGHQANPTGDKRGQCSLVWWSLGLAHSKNVSCLQRRMYRGLGVGGGAQNLPCRQGGEASQTPGGVGKQPVWGVEEAATSVCSGKTQRCGRKEQQAVDHQITDHWITATVPENKALSPAACCCAATLGGTKLALNGTGTWDRIHHFLILSGSYLRLTQDDDLTDLTERVLRDWMLPRGRNQSIYITSEACDLGRAASPLWTSVSSSVIWSCQLPKQLGSRWDKMRPSRPRAEKPRSRNRPCSLLPPGGGRRENQRAGGPGRQEEGSADAPRPARPRNVTRGAQEVLIQRLSLRPKTDTHGQGGLRLRPRKTHASPRPPGTRGRGDQGAETQLPSFAARNPRGPG
ncbi:uncharacterized protein AAEQ78_013752 isoform 1-T1 [Lycaon pictus]